MIGERIILAEIYKQNGELVIQFPNDRDVLSYELYGFLKCYVKDLEFKLMNSFTDREDDFE